MRGGRRGEKRNEGNGRQEKNNKGEKREKRVKRERRWRRDLISRMEVDVDVLPPLHQSPGHFGITLIKYPM